MPNLRSVLLTLALAASAPLAMASPNLITNGDFETGDLTGWTKVGAIGEQYVSTDFYGSPLARSGYAYYDGTTVGLGTLSQTVATVAGAIYTLSFDLQRINSGGPNTLDNQVKVSFGGVTLMDESNASGDWATVSFSGLTASAASSVLQFSLHNYYDYTGIDNVTLVMTAVPEPTMAIMLAAGLILLVRRRDKRPPPF